MQRWIDSLPDRARAVLPAPMWDYLCAGSFEGVTAAEAAAAWRGIRFAPRVLRDVSTIDTTTTILGCEYAGPIGVAPTSLQRVAHPEGEKAMVAGAQEARVPVVVSSNAGFEFAELGATGWWLQLYMLPDRHQTRQVVEAAVSAGASAIVLTVDTPVPGRKPSVTDSAWAGFDLSWHRANFSGHSTGWAQDLTESDIGWLAEAAGLPIVVKGVLRPDDARRAAGAGASAIWVSNHGGRQLDRSISTAQALGSVCAGLEGGVEVFVDGGISHGIDVLAALACGADAVFLGRLPLMALATQGSAGVKRLVIELNAELAEAMRLGGVTTPKQARGIISGTV